MSAPIDNIRWHVADPIEAAMWPAVWEGSHDAAVMEVRLPVRSAEIGLVRNLRDWMGAEMQNDWFMLTRRSR